MTLKKLGMVTVMGLALGLVGCGYSCEDFCEDGAECSTSDTNPEDCDANCEIIERVNEDFGCEEDFDEMLECAAEMDDICDDESNDCDDEALGYITCLGEYCADHPNNDDCGGVPVPTR